MLVRLLLLFTLVPIAELAILIWLVRRTDLLTAVVLIFATGAVGALLAKWQGFRAWRAIRADLNAGRLPAASVLDGVMILVAGALLLTPGLLTDVFGFLLLVPRVRSVFRLALLEFLRRRVTVHVQNLTARAGSVAPGDVIDVEFRRADASPLEDHSSR
jgi:UPF0716 protein FxsA